MEEHKSINQQENKPPKVKCPIHEEEIINYVCLEKDCKNRILCQKCVIFQHLKIHKSYAEISEFFNNPLIILQNSKQEKSLSNINYRNFIDEQVQNEEKNLDNLFQEIICKITEKFSSIREQFNQDILNHLESQKDKVNAIETNRIDYIEFCNSFFFSQNSSGDDDNNAEKIKEGINLVISKYFADNDLQENLANTLEAIPRIQTQNKYEIQIDKRKIEKLVWRNFADRYIGKY